MKKLFLLLALCLFVFLLVACDGDTTPHNHVFDRECTEDAYLKKAATLTDPATYYYSCSCGERGWDTFTYGAPLEDTEEKEDATPAHTCSYEWVYTADGHMQKCKDASCGAFTEEAPHTLGDWVTDTAPTCVETGARHRSCHTCGMTEEESLPADATAHEYVRMSDGTHHWKICLCKGCTATKGRAEHEFVDGVCLGCGENDTTYTREGRYIYFGEYPQSLKAANVTVTDTRDDRGYYLGSDGAYYAEVTAELYGSFLFQSGEWAKSGSVYYFKVEPIRWRILSEDGENALLLCDSILTAKAYDSDYDNNYATSDIRAWLNGELYRVAFSGTQRSLINTVEVDNSVGSTGERANRYTCENTSDKLFLLSFKEVTSVEYGFSTSTVGDSARWMRVSDYAGVTCVGPVNKQGTLAGNAPWWLRSPSSVYVSQARSVLENGDITESDYNVTDTVFNGSRGIVPALSLRLSAEP